MSFFDDFFGNSQRDDLNNASINATGLLDRGLDNYKAIRGDYLDRALGEYDALKPYGAAGLDTLSLLRNALGVNGPEAGRSFFENLKLDPGYTGGFDAGVDALDKSAAARGMLRSGGQQRDLFSFGNRFFGDFSNNRIGQLMGLFGPTMGVGVGAAGAKAGLFNNTGSDIAGADLGVNNIKAGNQVNLGNAMAASRSTGINNIIGLGNMVGNIARGFTGMPGGGFFGNGGGFETVGFDSAGNPNYGRR